MFNKLFVITVVLIFGLSMFAAGTLAPDDLRHQARSWIQQLATDPSPSSEEAGGAEAPARDEAN